MRSRSIREKRDDGGAARSDCFISDATDDLNAAVDARKRLELDLFEQPAPCWRGEFPLRFECSARSRHFPDRCDDVAQW